MKLGQTKSSREKRSVMPLALFPQGCAVDARHVLVRMSQQTGYMPAGGVLVQPLLAAWQLVVEKANGSQNSFGGGRCTIVCLEQTSVSKNGLGAMLVIRSPWASTFW